MAGQPFYPSPVLLRRGPLPTEDPNHKFEKWCRVAQVVAESADQTQPCDFTVRGPFTIPMGVRRQDVSLGESDKAWLFFCHPYHVFQPDGGFFNMPIKRGVLAATLVERANDGLFLYDEVGTTSTERVASNFSGALGIMRHRLFGVNPQKAHDFYIQSFLNTDLNLLKTFRIITLLLKTRNPRLLFQELDTLLQNKTVFTFLGEDFATNELQLIRRAASQAGQTGPRASVSRAQGLDDENNPFAINPDDFMSADRLRDGGGRQIVGFLKSRLDKFREEHGNLLEQIESRRIEAERELRELRDKIDEEQAKREQMAAVSRFLSGRMFNIDQARGLASSLETEIEVLKQKVDTLPGYDKIRELTRRFQDFNDISKSIERLASNIFDYNVGLNQIKELEATCERVRNTAGDERTKNLVRYHLRLRADILPRLLRVFSISAYVLRRPESLIGMSSGANVGRVNKIAEKLIEYFALIPLDGKKTLGAIFEEGWGQVRLLEARL